MTDARAFGAAVIMGQSGADRARAPAPDLHRLMGAFDAMVDGIALYDPDGRLAYYNEAYRQVILVYDLPELLGLTAAQIARICLDHGVFDIGDATPEAFLARRGRMHDGDEPDMILTMSSGVRLRSSRREMPGGWAVAVYTRVTEIERAREAAVNASLAKSNFLSTMSHEIRTPLTALLGMLDLLDDEPDAHRRAKLLQSIRRSGETLREIVNDILDVSKIEAGKMRLELAAFQPTELVRMVMDRHREAARWKGLKLRVQIDANVSRARIWDSLRLGQILDNLLSNAIKFTETGTIEVRLTDRAGEPLRIGVADTGIGMTPEQVEKALMPFEQADLSTARVFGGTGLGLSIISKLTELAGGRLSIESTPGQGSCFMVTLPLTEAPDEAAHHSRSPEQTEKGLAGRHFLVADDDETIREILSGLLQRLGAEVTLASDGLSVLALTEGRSFDAILLDNAMPGLNGIEAAQILRQRFGTDCPPLVVVTASLLNHEVQRFLDAGFDAHLGKPFRRAELESLLLRLLERPKSTDKPES